MPSLKIAGSVAFVTLALQGCGGGDKKADPAKAVLDKITKAQEDNKASESKDAKLTAEQCKVFTPEFFKLEKPSEEKPSEKKALKKSDNETEWPYVQIKNLLEKECNVEYAAESEKKLQGEAATLLKEVEAAKKTADDEAAKDKSKSKKVPIPAVECTKFQQKSKDLTADKLSEKVKKDLEAVDLILNDTNYCAPAK